MPYDKTKDRYKSDGSRSDFGRKSRINVKSDTVDLNPYAKSVTLLTAGTLKVLPVGNADGDPVAYTDELPVGFSPPFQVRRVYATGTTADVATVDD